MIECLRYKPINKGGLLGFADFYIPKMGLEIFNCTLHQKNGQRWINFPSREYKDENGETRYMPLLRFRNKDHFEVFCKQAKQAVEKKCDVGQSDIAEEYHEEIPF